MGRTAFAAIGLASVIVLSAVRAADFGCLDLPMNPEERPPDCDANPDPSGWCSCLKTTLSTDEGAAAATIEQGIIYVVDEKTIGKYDLSVSDGTLDLGSVSVGDIIGQMAIDTPSGQAENFYVRMDMVVTLTEQDRVEFDIIVGETNPTSIAIFQYDPMDAAHADGLCYHGSVQSFGPRNGFELIFEYLDYITDPSVLPPGATDTGLELSDLTSPNFTVPVTLAFPLPGIFTLPPSGSFEMTTVTDQILTDPASPVERTFLETFTVKPVVVAERFRRGDADGNGVLELTDAIFTLGFLFLGQTAPACLDAADADDTGVLELTDGIYLLTYLFLGGPALPAPGPKDCGPDGKSDTFAACVYKDC